MEGGLKHCLVRGNDTRRKCQVLAMTAALHLEISLSRVSKSIWRDGRERVVIDSLTHLGFRRAAPSDIPARLRRALQ